MAFIGTAFTDIYVRSITPTNTGALILGDTEVIEVDFAGTETFRLTTGLREFHDILPVPTGYLAATDIAIRELDQNFGWVGDFAIDAATVANQAGYGYFPEQLRLLSSGRIAVVAFACIVILEPNGAVVGVADGGPLELVAIETGGGMLLVPSAYGLGLVDPDTLEYFSRNPSVAASTGKWYSRSYPAPATTQSGRTCTTTLNSTGQAGRLHLLASPELSDQKLSLIGTDLPRNTFCLSFFSQHTQDVAHGDGRLCLSPLGSTLRRGPVAPTSADGSTRTDFDFQSPGLGSGFTAGTTWHFQILFRDTGPSGFSGTDSVYLTFEP